MNRRELPELHYITPFANVQSILRRGLLSHNRAARFNPESVAAPEIQARRKGRRIPNAGLLHDYVNLYICARNPMLFKRRDGFDRICVLSVSPDVLDIPNTIIADRNASSGYARFQPSPGGLKIIESDLVFAEFWTSLDQVEQWRKKSAKCAEVLVPGCVAAQHILKAYVKDDSCRERLRTLLANETLILDVAVNKRLFFA